MKQIVLPRDAAIQFSFYSTLTRRRTRIDSIIGGRRKAQPRGRQASTHGTCLSCGGRCCRNGFYAILTRGLYFSRSPEWLFGGETNDGHERRSGDHSRRRRRPTP